MTRGTLFLITKDIIYESLEFNGDMYPEGNGDKAYNLLKEVDNLASFKTALLTINEIYLYSDELIYEKEWFIKNITQDRGDGTSFTYLGGMFEEDGSIDFNNEYYSSDRFFSDWIFIKNISNKSINFKDKEGNRYSLLNGQTIRLNYGILYKEQEVIIDEN